MMVTRCEGHECEGPSMRVKVQGNRTESNTCENIRQNGNILRGRSVISPVQDHQKHPCTKHMYEKFCVSYLIEA
ncbi:hypothetical protein E2C01_090517 [Portunus trituberculatus]|uniref:Uncharacterized protein n=1 Tax=Portunus trituberculatus TaxID=210409 RepID=A0A5B7JGT2_PORTR|nr:hypothetical protein [Portunus trituberculatus]